MKNTEWFKINDQLKHDFVKNNIENNEYYELIRAEYNNANEQGKEDIIEEILYRFDDCYDAYYSIYVIMDSVEDFMEEHSGLTIQDAFEHEDFMIRDL